MQASAAYLNQSQACSAATPLSQDEQYLVSDVYRFDTHRTACTYASICLPIPYYLKQHELVWLGFCIVVLTHLD